MLFKDLGRLFQFRCGGVTVLCGKHTFLRLTVTLAYAAPSPSRVNGRSSTALLNIPSSARRIFLQAVGPAWVTSPARPKARPCGQLIVHTRRPWTPGTSQRGVFLELVRAILGSSRPAPAVYKTNEKLPYDLEDFFPCFCRKEPNALFLQ